MSQLRRGYLFGFLAYLMWGFFPLYFRLLEPAGALEILANRVIWSAVCVAMLLTAVRRWRLIAALVRQPAKVAGIIGAAILIAGNWGLYVYAVNSGQVVETALGYFINPLFTVVLGMVVFRERLRRAQWAALAVGGLAVAVLTVDYGRLPWIALALAGSFGGYGLVKKRLALPAAAGLFVESSALAAPAIGYLLLLRSTGQSTFGHGSPWHTVLLVGAGLVTAVPLLLFAAAANRIPLTSIGILQYVAPVLQLFCGVVLLGEPMPPVRLAGFALVWLALVVFSADGLRQARLGRRATPATINGPLVSPTVSAAHDVLVVADADRGRPAVTVGGSGLVGQ